jgi:peroxiredoxin
MTTRSRLSVLALGFAAAVGCSTIATTGAAPDLKAKPPAVGDEAKDFDLPALIGDPVKLSKLTDAGPVVLVVLRGYPGYQCPLCSRQVAEYIGKADAFKKAGATVVFVYPGPGEKLKDKANEFIKGKDYPEHFRFVLDPDYTFTKAYNLRWDAKGETAYPSAFVLDGKRKVTFAKVSGGHGDRAAAADVLKALQDK